MIRRAATVYYVGLDVSDKQTSVCVLFADGNLAWQGKVDTGYLQLCRTGEKR